MDRLMYALSRSDLIALARKYRLLSEARRARLGSRRDWSGLGRLYAEFPGADAELEFLSVEELEARHAELLLSARLGHVSDWARWMIAYHAAARAARRLRALLRSVPLSEDIVHSASRVVSREVGFTCDEEFVLAALSANPQRLGVIVRSRVVAEVGEPPLSVARLLDRQV